MVQCHVHHVLEIIHLELPVHHVLRNVQVVLRNDQVLIRKDQVQHHKDQANVLAVQEWQGHDQDLFVQVLLHALINVHKVIDHLIKMDNDAMVNLADNVQVARHLRIAHKVHHQVVVQVVVDLVAKVENHNNVVAPVVHLENRMARNVKI